MEQIFSKLVSPARPYLVVWPRTTCSMRALSSTASPPSSLVTSCHRPHCQPGGAGASASRSKPAMSGRFRWLNGLRQSASVPGPGRTDPGAAVPVPWVLAGAVHVAHRACPGRLDCAAQSPAPSRPRRRRDRSCRPGPPLITRDVDRYVPRPGDLPDQERGRADGGVHRPRAPRRACRHAQVPQQPREPASRRKARSCSVSTRPAPRWPRCSPCHRREPVRCDRGQHRRPSPVRRSRSRGYSAHRRTGLADSERRGTAAIVPVPVHISAVPVPGGALVHSLRRTAGASRLTPATPVGGRSEAVCQLGRKMAALLGFSGSACPMCCCPG